MKGNWVVVIFGARGDLAKRKLLPALFRLDCEGHLPGPDRLAILGVARAKNSNEEFRELVQKTFQSAGVCTQDDERVGRFLDRCFYLSADLISDGAAVALRDFLRARVHLSGKPVHCLFYFATPSHLFGPVTERLARAGLASEAEGVRRFVYEKPFGEDLQSAQALNTRLLRWLGESQIYRIDHYLGKETVQNIMVLRFANGIFEPIWNRSTIESVSIHVDETVGVEDRAGYYEGAGALRDMVPNHLFQLLTLVAMEPPSSFDAEAIRDEKAKVLRAVRPIHARSVDSIAFRGQYGSGPAGVGYREEKGVEPRSNIETFVSLRLDLENWRWSGVPFYLRTGKRLPSRCTEVRVRFKCAPLELFRKLGSECLHCNELKLFIQPEEKIALYLGAKVPGLHLRVGEVAMQFDYQQVFGNVPRSGYETLIYDCLMGDSTLFQRTDQIELAWSIVDPILKAWKENPPKDFPNYRAGEMPTPMARRLERAA